MQNDQSIVISDTLPEPIRLAALEYIAPYDDDLDWEDLDRELHLIEAFGELQIGNIAHRQVTWLCALASQTILWCWAQLECEGDAPERALKAVTDWVLNDLTPSEWDSLIEPAVPIRDGKPIQDCDVLFAKPVSESAAKTVRFACMGEVTDAVDVLLGIWYAVWEIEWAGPMQFNEWFITVALPAAYNLQPLSEYELSLLTPQS